MNTLAINVYSLLQFGGDAKEMLVIPMVPNRASLHSNISAACVCVQNGW